MPMDYKATLQRAAEKFRASAALAAALSVSGIEAQEFTFFGFLPRHKAQLREKLLDMARTLSQGPFGA